MRRRIRVDARALAALRVALGLLLLADLLLRARTLGTFYTDDGIATRAVLAEIYPLHPSLSVHALSGDLWFQVVLFVVAGIAAVALAVGYRTRVATLISVVLLVSLHARNPTVLNSGDVLLRRLLFLSLFLPLGACWSIDGARNADARTDVANLASLALLLQVVIVYATNAVFKHDSQLWLDGKATGYVLSLDRFSVLLGPLLSEIEPVVTLLDWIWLGLLIASPLLLVTTGIRRGLLAAAFAAMHLGMVATIDLGIFPLVSVAALLPFFPATVWDRIERIPTPVIPALIGEGSNVESTTDRSAPITDSLIRFQPAVRALVLATLLVASAMGVGLLSAPDGAPEQLSDSSWTMFASPPTHHTWVVAEGEFASGRTTDLLHDRPARLDRPPDVDRFPNARWRKHFSRYDGSSPLPAAYADTRCEQYAGDGARLESIQLVRVWQPVDGDGEDAIVSELGTYHCAEGEAVPAGEHVER